ncbi:MAG: diadenosine tetraphosphate hydrolase [Candidatus Pacebacteria bacterium CG10_big_fil_rev_8_21_14_0_10_36_11]|nr:HIT family protein [Candidatus Pacearchaeota archaeon]OIP74533.1 MAG: diadenosine tetraphosphate hydrolase [Candidatus Pacebacteria bacterium CG2_30_36_39]PIR65159.1 MAG: diadenosine tetraphosphate hydrolase [Candidatus Pacebacteria bacterium CG10_big_fil_rev_8_21_14_0_10_36_11]PJC42650.1 MAG: diadenosine tetraphosphate hydrolase [Candidatus Pacebacteria bacterium CG_4_9_14_0_2_um_filter_36_8]
MDNCIFCQIAQGNIPSHKIWEDDGHLAFLSIFPNTEGFTVVIPKKHYGSYAFAQEDIVLEKLIIATKKVANLLDKYFADVARCGMFFEGFGVDHLHSKLFPMHGTGNLENWEAIESKKVRTYFKQYPGYLSSNDSNRAEDSKLENLAANIRKASV